MGAKDMSAGIKTAKPLLIQAEQGMRTLPSETPVPSFVTKELRLRGVLWPKVTQRVD